MNGLNHFARQLNRSARTFPQTLAMTCLLACVPVIAATEALPPIAPAPAARPDAPPSPDAESVPLGTPDAQTDDTPPDRAPIPSPRPHAADRSEPAQPVAAAMPEAERLCRDHLRAMGATFTEAEPVAEEAGCRIDHPLMLSGLGEGVSLEPAALINCAIAETTVRFVREVVAPQASRRFGGTLVTVGQASGYVCRPRNGTSKLSEHAFGNAIDFSSFVLEDGRVILAEASSDRSRRNFLRALRGQACGRFKTVLGPGSDADHADHLHLDLAERRGGGTYCQ